MNFSNRKIKDVPVPNMILILIKALRVIFALVIVLHFCVPLAVAQTYPTKPVRLMIGFVPGGSNDIVGRMIANKLTERLGQQVVVENRGGAGATIATEFVAKAEPNGYTLLLGSASHTISPSLYKVRYDPLKSFIPIAMIGRGPMALVAHPSVPANSVKEFIALAKKQPGKLICAAAGVGAIGHLASELFKRMADIDYKIVQFKGGGPALVDVLGGHSHIEFSNVIHFLPHIQSGKIRVLGTSGLKRSAVLPNVPTIIEGGIPGYEAYNWWGIIAPAGTPVSIVDRLTNELKGILALAEINEMFKREGADVDYKNPSEFGQFIAEELTRWSRVIKDAKIEGAE